jgi:hypothetical protein
VKERAPQATEITAKACLHYPPKAVFMLRAHAHVCIVCHGTEFTENELGHAVCEECGTQIVQLSQMEEVNEDNTQIARVGGHLNAIRIKSGTDASVLVYLTRLCVLFCGRYVKVAST